MQTTIKKWGSDALIQISESFLEQSGFNIGDEVELSVKDGKLIVSHPEENQEQLLSDVSANNKHAEIDFGPDVGMEIID